MAKKQTMLEAALAYVALGIPVFPCGMDKRPLTPKGFKNATKDKKTVERYWTRWPQAMIGMPTGKVSGISVCDLDKKKDKNGLKAVPDWKDRSNVISITMHGGSHLIYADKKGEVPCTTSKVAPGVDTRGDGGYIIVPPSKGYKWLNGHNLFDHIKELKKYPADLKPSKQKASARVVRNITEEPADIERVRRAMMTIPSDDYDEWYRVAGALRQGLGDEGHELWHDWSKRSDKYVFADADKKWDQAEKITNIPVGWLFKIATKYDPHWDELDELPDGADINDFVSYMPSHNYIYLPTGQSWPATSVNARMPKMVVGGKKISAALYLDKFRRVEGKTWSPGDPEMIKGRVTREAGGWVDKPGDTCLNLYYPPSIQLGNARRAQRWLDLVKMVYPDDWQHIIAYLAHRVQHPGEKINHSLVLGGPPGIGKDSILEPVKFAIGPWNFREATPKQAMSRFNSHVKSVILRISEARDLGEFNRYDFYESTKELIAAPPDMLSCEEKHIEVYMVPNVTAVIMTTNHKTSGIFLPPEDRRHYVAWSRNVKEDNPPEFWNSLYKWYREGGHEDVAAYLHKYDLKNFNPKAPPKQTDAFLDIVEANLPLEDADFATAINNLGVPKAVTIDLIFRASADNEDFQKWLEDRRNKRAIQHRIESCQYAPVRDPSRGHNRWRYTAAPEMTGSVGKQREVQVYALKTLKPGEQITAAKNLIAQLGHKTVGEIYLQLQKDKGKNREERLVH